MAHRYFEGVVYPADLYGKYRPIPPETLIDRVVDYLKESVRSRHLFLASSLNVLSKIKLKFL